MNSLPIIQSLWIGDEISVMERLCICSFLQNGHPFHLYVYDNVKGIPEGTTIKDANEIVPRDKIFKYKGYNSYAGFANLFRYKLLFEKGNYWVDADIICLAPFVHDTDHLFSGEKKGPELGDEFGAGNCVIKAPKGSTIMEYCYRTALEKDPESLEWGDTGPKLLSDAIVKFNMASYIAHYKLFCPINWWEWYQLLEQPEDEEVLIHSYAVHLWHEMWRRNDVDKSDTFDEYSLYEQLKRAYFKE